MRDASEQRRHMVEHQLRRRGIGDERVLAAMGRVPREAFVPPSLVSRAHEDGPLPIGEDQTISQPFVVALMAEAAAIGPGDRVLDVGTGSGYAAAVLAELAAEVFSIERMASLAERARACLEEQGYGRVRVRHGDGTRGWPEAAPFDAILIAAAADAVPDALLGQLAPGGRLVAPIGPRFAQRLLRLRRRADGTTEETDLGPVAFVPLIADPPAGDAAGEG
jgi:protein-L-isoaspartate(D-aspartate) O-methyltransferase